MKNFKRAAVGAVASIALLFGLSQVAEAKKKPSVALLPGAACSVTPNPVAPGDTYTITGTGLPANGLVNVRIVEALGTQSGSNYTDDTGTVVFNSRSYWPGDVTVEITEWSGSANPFDVYTICTFTVV